MKLLEKQSQKYQHFSTFVSSRVFFEVLGKSVWSECLKPLNLIFQVLLFLRPCLLLNMIFPSYLARFQMLKLEVQRFLLTQRLQLNQARYCEF